MSKTSINPYSFTGIYGIYFKIKTLQRKTQAHKKQTEFVIKD